MHVSHGSMQVHSLSEVGGAENRVHPEKVNPCIRTVSTNCLRVLHWDQLVLTNRERHTWLGQLIKHRL